MGGIRLEGLDRMHVTLKITVEHLTVRHNLDLYNDNQVEKLIRKYVKVPLSQQQFDALGSYVFNVGPGNSLLGTNLIKHLNQGNYTAAAKEMDIATSGGVRMRGLVRRREAEQAIWLKGIYQNNK